MIATRYPCALIGTVLSLVVVFGSAQVATAQPNANVPGTEQTLQQMSALFPTMNNPSDFIRLQNAYNQMLMTLPNDPWGNGYARMNTTPQQNNLFGNQPGSGQNSLFPNQPGVGQQQPGANPNGRLPNQPVANQNQFGKKPNQPNVGQQQACHKNPTGAIGQGTANANSLRQQQAAFQQQQAAFQQQQAAFLQQQAAFQQQQQAAAHHQHHHHKK